MLPNCIYQEEDLFPGRFASREDRPYGVLFYNEINRDSYDSNHALIYRERVEDLDWVLRDIKQFYLEKGLKPIIYQAILDDGYLTRSGRPCPPTALTAGRRPRNTCCSGSPAPSCPTRK